MAKEKYDGVIEAAHYKPDGELEWVRAYLRRGPTFSDWVIIKRDDLVKYLKAGKVFMVGQRVPQLASTFQVSYPVRIINTNGQEVLVVGDKTADKDRLEGVPVL